MDGVGIVVDVVFVRAVEVVRAGVVVDVVVVVAHDAQQPTVCVSTS